MICSEALRANGQAYPRTCKVCGLGPCTERTRPEVNVTPLKVAEAPAKDNLLALVEELRAGIEGGTIISLVAIPIHPSREWTVRSAGEVRMLELAGILGGAWLDAQEALKR
jgi:hypothetical protein